MASSKDFVANQIRAAKVIMTGSQPGDGGIGVGNIGLSIYDQSIALNDEGGVSDGNLYAGAGSEVKVFISGSANYKGRDAGNSHVLFGGNLSTSGSMHFMNPALAQASVTITSSGSPNNGQALTLIATDGASVTLTLTADGTDATGGGGSASNIHFARNGSSTHSLAELKALIEAHPTLSEDFTVSSVTTSGSNKVITILQIGAGSAGNTVITNNLNTYNLGGGAGANSAFSGGIGPTSTFLFSDSERENHLYLSGTFFASGSSDATPYGTISGSIHHTRDGLSYLVAGSNITIASASNGQVTITAAAGGGDVGLKYYDENNTSPTISPLAENDSTGAVAIGENNIIGGSTFAGIFEGSANHISASSYATIVGGGSHQISGSSYSNILGGVLHKISGSEKSFVVAGMRGHIRPDEGSGAEFNGILGSNLSTIDQNQATSFNPPKYNLIGNSYVGQILDSQFSTIIGSDGTSQIRTTNVGAIIGSDNVVVSHPDSEINNLVSVVGSKDISISGKYNVTASGIYSSQNSTHFSGDRVVIIGGKNHLVGNFGGSEISQNDSILIGSHISASNPNSTTPTVYLGFGSEHASYANSSVIVSGSFLKSDGANGGAITGSITRTKEDLSYLVAGTNVTIASASNGQITISASGGAADGMGSGFVLEDGDGTEVAITENKEVKIIGAGGIVTNWTDVSNGTDVDPYDLTITGPPVEYVFSHDGPNQYFKTVVGIKDDVVNATAESSAAPDGTAMGFLHNTSNENAEVNAVAFRVTVPTGYDAASSTIKFKVLASNTAPPGGSDKIELRIAGRHKETTGGTPAYSNITNDNSTRGKWSDETGRDTGTTSGKAPDGWFYFTNAAGITIPNNDFIIDSQTFLLADIVNTAAAGSLQVGDIIDICLARNKGNDNAGQIGGAATSDNYGNKLLIFWTQVTITP